MLMQDFLADLDEQLAVVASSAPTPRGRPARVRRRLPLAAGGAAAVIAGAGALLMAGTSTADLPIFSTPTTDATALRGQAPGAARLGVDFSAAHVFRTPAGPGYVVTGTTSDALCMVVPDPHAPGDFGTACARSLGEVERRGLRAEFPGDRAIDPDAMAVSAFLLPDGAKDVRLTVSGRTTAPKIHSGVVVTEVPTEGKLHWTVGGRPQSQVLEGPFQAGGSIALHCPDGRELTGPAPPLTPGTTNYGPAIKAATKKACAR